MADLTGVSQGFFGYGGIASESIPGGAGTPGLFVPPTQFLLMQTDSIDSVPAMITRDVETNSRDPDRGYRTGKETVSGQITHGLYPNNGILLPIAGIGKDVMTTAVAPDTTVSITTANDLSTLVLTGGTGPYRVGQRFDVDTGANLEVRQVGTWDPVTKTVTVGALTKTHSSAGTTVAAPAVHAPQPYTMTDGVPNLLRTISYYQDVGGKYANCYPNGQVNRWEIRATAQAVDVTTELVFSSPRFPPTSPVAFDEADPTLDDLSFEFTDCFMMVPADQQNSGTPTLQKLDLGQDFTLALNNNFKAEPCADGTDVMRHFPGRRQVTGSFKYLSTATYPVYFRELLKRNLDFPFFVQFALNVGTSLAPVYQFLGVYLPHCRVTTTPPIRGLNDDIGETVNFTARRAGGLEKIYLFISNSQATVY